MVLVDHARAPCPHHFAMIGIADPGVPRNELDAKTNTGPDVMPSPAKLDE
jgi:hypothetical protein